MKRSVILAGIFVAGWLITGTPVFAITTVYDFVDLNEFVDDQEYLRYKHDITDQGFDPDCDCLIDADLYIYFKDDNDSQYSDKWEKVTVYFDGDFIEHRTIPDSWSEVPDFGYELEYFNVLLSYVDDGMLEVKLYAKKDDFKVKWSKLIVKFEDKDCDTPQVPEPATVLLMGLGASGLLLRKRMA